MLTNTRGFSKYPLFTVVQVECGTTTFGLEETPKAAKLTDADSVVQAYGSIAAKLSSYGINMNLAPVAEVSSEENAFSTDTIGDA